MKIVELILDEEQEGGIEAISIVESPAIESDFVALESQEVKLAEVDKEKKILLGALLIPNKPIYRNGAEGDYYIFFSKETIVKASQMYLKNGYQNKSTLEHAKALNGLTLVESWIVESETQDKRLELENSITTINKKGVVTKIHAGFAIITNEYNDFNLSKKVKIIKKSRQFLLETNSLIGTLKEGNFFTNERVAILAGNTKINGEGLDLKNNGDYIKIKGKATLVMLLSNK